MSGTTDSTPGALLHHPWWRVVLTLGLVAAAIASPALVRGVSAAPGQAGAGETLVYHSTWQTGRLDWSAHHLRWSIAQGILRMRPGNRHAPGATGWIVAPYRPSQQESFAIEAVMRFAPAIRCWCPYVVSITTHFGPGGTGVSGQFLLSTSSGPIGGIAHSTAPGIENRIVGSPVNPGRRHWHTYRLEVRYGGGEDHYSFFINAVQVAQATLKDWMEHTDIAIVVNDVAVQVKSLKVYRLH